MRKAPPSWPRAYAKWTGRIGCCFATTGPGGLHLLNGLYDAKLDLAPVVAMTGLPYHDIADTFTQQDVPLDRVFADVAGLQRPHHGRGPGRDGDEPRLPHRAGPARAWRIWRLPSTCRKKPEDEPSPRGKAQTSAANWVEGLRLPDPAELAAAAEILNGAQRVAILAGRGRARAREAELEQVAETLGAPVIKALLGKAVLPDEHPLTTGGIGLSAPSAPMRWSRTATRC